MDNFTLDVTGRGPAGLRLALELAFLGHDDNAHAYFWRQDVQDGVARLVLGSAAVGDADGWHPWPAPLTAVAAAETAGAWLGLAEYPREPDHDGHNVRGWRVVVGCWGHVEGYRYGAFASVLPAWACCGK